MTAPDRPADAGVSGEVSYVAGAAARSAAVPALGTPPAFASPPDATGGGGSQGVPVPTLPKGGGALRGIGEKFSANPVTGTVSLAVPLGAPGGRNGFGPELMLRYDSGCGNGPFGLGWSLGLPAITRKTDKGVPCYDDVAESDIYLLSGSEDLVPVTDRAAYPDAAEWGIPVPGEFADVERDGYRIRFYRPRIEGLYARIERWTQLRTGGVHWRTVTRDDVITVFGPDDRSRITAETVAGAPRRVFSWLVRYSYDDRGNAVVYDYDAENSAHVRIDATHERNRDHNVRAVQRYLRRVRYGNRTPARDPDAWDPVDLADRPDADWMFSVVFDYDEGLIHAAPPDERGRIAVHTHVAPTKPWAVRPDPFSSYRAGFEIRTYRRCARALIFHHFPEELGVADYLVRDTELGYADSPVASLLTSATQHSYQRLSGGSWRQQPMPAVALAYSARPAPDELSHRRVQELDRGDVAALAGALAGTNQWLDLDASGAPGLLAEQGGSWLFTSNLSPLSDGRARLGQQQVVPAQPTASLNGGQSQFLDLDADGRPELVDLREGARGYFARTDDGWAPFRALPLWPNLDPADPNLRLADLTGDGLVDLLVTADQELHWSAGHGVDGFGMQHPVPQALSDRAGPRLLSADASEAVLLADLSGDGLADLVRVREGEVCYWPNLGYGRFGRQVVMDRSPRFAGPTGFDPRRVRMVDTDGSGPTDLIYLGADAVQVHVNEAGNGWAAPAAMPQLRAGDTPSAIQAVDLLGNGTSCLVWAPGRPGEDSRPLRYVAMYEHKPDLLVSVVNNLGAETHVGYAPSTRFYLRDQERGTPWVTRLPFPVQVLETVLTVDRIAHSVFASRYDYHHGFFDGVEREFRGFGMVEQWDTADIATLSASLAGTSVGIDSLLRHAANLRRSDVPPVLVRSWFHTGAPIGDDPIADGLAHALTRDGYRALGAAEPGPSTLPVGLDADERREALRALRGSPLRRETYGVDGTERQAHPYEVQVHAHTVRLRQHRGPNKHAVFDVQHRETVAHSYERDPADPRTTHMLTLDVDPFGNVLASAAIGYGRRVPDASLGAEVAARQSDRLAVWNENSVTNLVGELHARRTPSTWRARKAEIVGLPAPAAGRLLAADEVRAFVATAPMLPYEADVCLVAGAALRLVGESVITFRADDLSKPLPLGRQGALGITLASRRLALTHGLLAQTFTDPHIGALLAEGGHLRDEAGWWIPTGRTFYTVDPQADAATELATARRHFFTVRRYRDPFHPDDDSADHVVTFDRHDLLVQETRDALGNRSTVGERAIDPDQPLVRGGYDYRVLQAALMMGPNRNRRVTAFDTLGLVVATAVMGAPEDDPQPGDSLNGLDLDLGEAEVRRWLRDGPTDPAPLLGAASERIVYDLYAYRATRLDAQPEPVVSYSIARETHVSDLDPGERSRLQQSFCYSDGFGRGLQDKKLVEPTPRHQRARQENEQRWVTTGWTVYNNKGKPVRTFEPFFTDHPRFEFDVEAGVSTIVVYDPVERAIATLRPDSTWEKRAVSGWSEQTWDVNDTLLLDPREDPDVGGFVRRIDEPSLARSWFQRRIGGELGRVERDAAERAATAAGTPSVSHADSLGRTILNISHNRRDGADSFQHTRLALDVESHARAVVDAVGRTVLQCRYDMAGRVVREDTMDGGARWSLADIRGAPLAVWDEGGHRFRTGYDVLRRPVRSWVRTDDGPEVMFARTIYGEGQPDAERQNLRTQVVEVHDQSGVVFQREFDFKGELLLSERRFAREYRQLIDCAGDVELEPETYPTRTSYDALGRPTSSTAPDGSVTRPRLNQDGLLERLEVVSPGRDEATLVVADISYDAHGRRLEALFGNGVRTCYEYDPETFRMVRLRSTRARQPVPRTGKRPAGTRGRQVLQDLTCLYDPVGNVMHLRDSAQPRLFFRNAVVDPDREYSYDALYRLATATGREELGQDGSPMLPEASWPGRVPRLGDEAAMGRYREIFGYDAVGNITAVRHRSADPSNPGWKRRYDYDEPSRIQTGFRSNRLSRTISGDRIHRYHYDAAAGRHGMITGMTRLHSMDWDAFDQLHSVAQQVAGDGGTPERTFYVYDSSGARVRSVTERAAAAGTAPRRRRERRYLGSFEQFRMYRGDGSLKLERDTLTVADDAKRVAAVETRTVGDDRSPARLVRFALADLAGSVAVEVDDRARLLSYEEYYSFGETSFRRQSRRAEAPKRYRFSGQERDEESGLYHAGARYFMPWLGRWIAPDPAGLTDGTNRYAYVRNNPLKYSDPSGMGCDLANQSCADPTATTAAEDAAQACLPEEHPQEVNSSHADPPAAPDPYAAPDRDHSLATFTLGDRGEHFRDPGDTRPPRALTEYTKPYAIDAARAGNYEYAELAENYLCASCHVIAHYGHVPTDSEFSINTYVSTYKRNYAVGQAMVGFAVLGVAAPEAAALVGAWETGVGTGETITGHTSGIHVTNLITWDYDGGRKMTGGERVFTGVMAGVGWVTMGMGALGPRGEPGAQLPNGELPPPPGGNGGMPANPRQYSTAYETQLNPADYGRSRAVHFNRANAALDADMAANPELAATMEELIPGVRQSVSSQGGRATPEGWTWEHTSTTTANGRTGVMRLVPTSQHTAGTPFWRVLHPDPGAAGGYSEWAIPAGAPKN